MAVGDWSATTLCLDSDLIGHESRVLSWSADEPGCRKWRDLAKEQIGNKLRFTLKDIELATDIDEVLDLISNPEELKTVACYLSLHLLANDCMKDTGDYYNAKAAFYLGQFDKEYSAAVSMLHVDTDEGGSIDDTEKYNVDTGVKMTRGA